MQPFGTHTLFHVGPVPVTTVVVTTWVIMAVLVVGAWLGTRRMRVDAGRWQAALEVIVETIDKQIRDVVQRDPSRYTPLLATLFLFIAIANLSAMIPGVSPPTAHIETDAALAGIVFLSVHVYGVATHGLGGYLKRFARPNLLLLPLNLIGEITRTFSLMVRLFGNIMSHEIVIGVVLTLAGLLVPIPLMALAIVIGIVQAYIFTILATVFIGAAVETSERQRSKEAQ
jgi:F-type H+-transporting ATPase subunit a